MAILTNMRNDLAAAWRRFWNQPDRAFRNFQIAFCLLGVHFIIPSISYAFWPQNAAWSFAMIGHLLGGDLPYRVSEQSYIWRVLAVANVFTLGFMCFTLMANIKRFYPVLLPLCVLKITASAGFFVVYTWRYHFPAYLAVSIWDATNVLMFLYFAHTARWSVEEWGEEVLVPRLFFKQQ